MGKEKPVQRYASSAISPQEEEAARQFVASRTVFVHDPSRSDNDASGVHLKLDSHHFIITVAHVLSKVRLVELMVEQDRPPVMSFLQLYWDSKQDLGVIEIGPESAAILANFATEQDLAPCFEDAKWPVLFAGFPSAAYRLATPGLIVAHGLVASSCLVPSSSWPKDWPARESLGPLKASRDLLVQYPDAVYSLWTSPTQPFDPRKAKECRAPSPLGISGGGIWLLSFNRHTTTGLMFPAPRLVGLQISFAQGQKMLRARKIGLLLDLLLKHYPDLREPIRKLKNAGTLRREDSRHVPHEGRCSGDG